MARGITIKLKNLQRTASGKLEYRKVVPAGLRRFVGQTEFKLALDTKDELEAAVRAASFAAEVDAKLAEAREELRKSKMSVEERLLETVHHSAKRSIKAFIQLVENRAPKQAQPVISPQDTLTIRKTLKLYLHEKNRGTKRKGAASERFESVRTAEINAFIDHIGGDRDITTVTREDCRSYRNKREKEVKASTVNHRIGLLKTIFQFGKEEVRSSLPNPWNGVKSDDEVPDKERRRSFTKAEIEIILAKLISKEASELRTIALITAFTGARINEIVGLNAEEVKLDTEIPYILIQSNENRRTKTKQSKRLIPLPKPLIDLLQGVPKTGPIFPEYMALKTPSDSFSVSINQYFLRKDCEITDAKATWHSWRHTMKDALRNTGASDGVQNQILGHTQGGMSGTYGDGYSLAIRKEALDKALAPMIKIFNDQ